MPGAMTATSAPTNGKANGTARAGTSKSHKEIKDSDASDSDDVPLGASADKKRATKPPAKKKPKMESDEDVFGEAVDAQKSTKSAHKATNGKAKKEAKGNDAEETPQAKKKAPVKKRVKKEESADAEDAPKPKKARAKKEEEASPKKKGKKGDGEEDGEEVFKWWEQEGDPEGDGSIKWQTLEHSGVYFPPPYEPLPSGVKMKYNGEWLII